METSDNLKPAACLCDIDGTLARAVNRMWWDYDECDHDDVCPAVFGLLQMAKHSGINVILVTGRPLMYEGKTEEWLSRHRVPYDQLVMRPEGDYSSNNVHKLRVYQDSIQPFYDVRFCVDDNPRTIATLRDAGLFVFDVGNGNWVDEMPDPKLEHTKAVMS